MPGPSQHQAGFDLACLRPPTPSPHCILPAVLLLAGRHSSSSTCSRAPAGRHISSVGTASVGWHRGVEMPQAGFGLPCITPPTFSPHTVACTSHTAILCLPHSQKKNKHQQMDVLSASPGPLAVGAKSMLPVSGSWAPVSIPKSNAQHFSSALQFRLQQGRGEQVQGNAAADIQAARSATVWRCRLLSPSSSSNLHIMRAHISHVSQGCACSWPRSYRSSIGALDYSDSLLPSPWRLGRQCHGAGSA